MRNFDYTRLTEKSSKPVQVQTYAGHNGNDSEVREFVNSLNSYAKKRHMTIVFPGSFLYDGIKSPTTMILVGAFGILLIRCYGFGGHIYLDEKKHVYMQDMNNIKKVIINPVESALQEQGRMISLLSGSDFKNTPVKTAAVFTGRNVVLDVGEYSHIYNRKTLNAWLKTPEFEEDNGICIPDLTGFLMDQVKRTE